MVAISLALIVPVSAEGTTPRIIQPGDTIEVGAEPLVLDIVALRDPDTLNPVTDLRRYKDDNPAKRVDWVIGVPNDGYFRLNDQAFGGKFGRYFVYSEKDGLLKYSVTFVPAPEATPTPVETPTTVTPTDTPAEPATTDNVTDKTTAETTTPLPGLIVIAAIGISGLIAVTRKRK